MRSAPEKRRESMELVAVDSSFFIHALRTKRQPFLELGQLANQVEWATTGMIVLEVCRGVREARMRDIFAAKFSTMICLPTTNAVWEKAAKLAWSLDRKGTIIPAQDAVIASVCLTHGASLLTHDAHFSVVPGLEVASSLGDLP